MVLHWESAQYRPAAQSLVPAGARERSAAKDLHRELKAAGAEAGEGCFGSAQLIEMLPGEAGWENGPFAAFPGAAAGELQLWLRRGGRVDVNGKSSEWIEWD